MTIFARADVDAVQHHLTGEWFKRNPDAPVFAIDSDPEFEQQALAAHPDLYSATVDGLLPTPDEIAAMSQREQEEAVVAREHAAAAAEVHGEGRSRTNRWLSERPE